MENSAPHEPPPADLEPWLGGDPWSRAEAFDPPDDRLPPTRADDAWVSAVAAFAILACIAVVAGFLFHLVRQPH